VVAGAWAVSKIHIISGSKVKNGSKQVDYDPPIGKLICFGKVGFKRYKDTMRKLFKKRMLVKK